MGLRDRPETNAVKCPFLHQRWSSEQVPWKRLCRSNYPVTAQNALGTPCIEGPSELGQQAAGENVFHEIAFAQTWPPWI